MVNRFNKIGPSLFQDTQTCSVRGRRINDSINAIKDVIDDANLKKIEAFIVSVDQKKDFDSMSHKYLYALLEHLGISPFLNKWVLCLYSCK